jgi:histidine triad (HIT) family protein
MTTASPEPKCLFCRIIAREIPATIVWEDDHALAFRDLNPQAPVHCLVIPKKHIIGIHHASLDDVDALGRVFHGAREAAEKLGVSESGYRLVVNQGKDAGQSVFHLHVHLLAGRPLAWPPG